MKEKDIQQFLKAECFAVAGASANESKYGNKVFRALRKSGREVFAINPNATVVAGQSAFAAIGDLPKVPQAISIVTPPIITRQIIRDAIEAGVRHVWMQPGAEHPAASQDARDAGLTVIDDGSCILVLLAIE